MMTTEITEAGRELAAELANAEGIGSYRHEASDFDERTSAAAVAALARLATVHLAMKGDMAEVHTIARNYSGLSKGVAKIEDIAARWRVETDPLLIEAREICAKDREKSGARYLAQAHRDGTHDDVPMTTIALAALKRGIELAKAQP